MTEKCKQSNACGHGMSQQQSIDEIRADNITEICKKVNKDPVVMMMTEWYDLYEKNVSCRQLYPGFEKQVSNNVSYERQFMKYSCLNSYIILSNAYAKQNQCL